MTPVTSGRWLATSSFPPFKPKPRFGSGTDAPAEAANLCYFLNVYVSDIQGQFEFFNPSLRPFSSGFVSCFIVSDQKFTFSKVSASLRGVGLAPQRLCASSFLVRLFSD